MNCLFYGDNLDILRQHVGDSTVDLVYLDPPSKSDQTTDRRATDARQELKEDE